jgi:DNA polymerase (family 10)
MENPEVAGALDEVADLLEIRQANPFRVRAYRNAARTVRDLPERLPDLLGAEGTPLENLPGIGADLAGKISTLVNTGDLPLLRELREQVPAGLREIVAVPGLGPKRARALYEREGVTSLDQLREAARRHRIRELDGFGETTEANILRGAESVRKSAHRAYLAEAKVYADALLRHLEAAPGLRRAEVAGSYRRRKETVGDLDLLAVCDDPGGVMDALARFDGVAEVVARGETKMTVRLRTGLQIDLRAVAAESYGAALAYFTGSKPHNIALRRLAQARGLKLNEYGVFRGARRVAGRTEEEVYAALRLPWIPPELREDRGEIEAARDGRLPRLLEPGQVRGDLHVHTTATDGRDTLAAMVSAAKARGHAYVAITDHSKRVTVAHGMDAARLRRHWKAIDRLAARENAIAVLKGVEVDILEDGRLDLPDEVLAEADYVVASIHYGRNQSREKITERMLNAVRHPHVHAIGHPTGRLIGHRPPYDLDLTAVLTSAAAHGCLMELNCQPSRLDLDDVAVRAAKELGVKVVLGSDAHAVEELGFMEFGVFQARRGWLEAGDVANTRTLAQLRKLLKRRVKARAGARAASPPSPSLRK